LLDTFYGSEDYSFPIQRKESEHYSYECELYRYERILDFHLSCEDDESKTLKVKLATMFAKYLYYYEKNSNRADDIAGELLDTIDDLIEKNEFTF
jgi:hypothetical protein